MWSPDETRQPVPVACDGERPMKSDRLLALPVEDVVKTADDRIRKTYGEVAKLSPDAAHALSLAIVEGALTQNGGHAIRLKHIFVDMTLAA